MLETKLLEDGMKKLEVLKEKGFIRSNKLRMREMEENKISF